MQNPAPTGVQKWRYPAVLVVIFMVASAAALRFHDLAAKTFWFDEGVSVGIARLNAYNFLRILWRREANMSLYYLLLRVWLHLGSSQGFIRSLSVIFALATIPVLYYLGARLFDSRTGLFAAALLTVNAYHIRYSQEARSYSLMVLLCTLSCFYFLEYLQEPSPKNRIVYVVFSALAVYAHFYSLLLIVSHWLSLRFLTQEDIPAGLDKAWKQIGIAVAPILLFVATTGAGPLRWIPRPGPRELWEFASLLTGSGGAWLVVAYTSAIGVVLSSTLMQPWNHRLPWEVWRYRFLAVWLFFPPLFVVILSQAKPLFLPRYFIFCLPALLLLAAVAISKIRPVWLALLPLFLFVALSLRGTRSYYQQDFDSERDDWRSASRYILANERTGDAMLFHVPMGRMPYEYYHSLSSGPAPQVLYPYHGSQITFLDFVEKPDYTKIAQALPQYPRVWLVISHAETPAGLDHVATTLDSLVRQSYSLSEEREFHGIYIRLYQK